MSATAAVLYVRTLYIYQVRVRSRTYTRTIRSVVPGVVVYQATR